MFLSHYPKRRGVRALTLALSLTLSLSLALPALAQNLDSTTYTILAPSIGEPFNDISDSSTYSQLIDSSPIDDYIVESTTYRADGGSANIFEANVPTVTCFETTTTSGSPAGCTGIPGSDRMKGVCSSPGCYDRAKLEINAQGNPDDARYAIQISTTSDFSSNVFYVDATTRLLKASLTVNDFIPKCEWEGTTVSGICGSPNTTWQKFDILGLTANTTYYVRLSAHRGLTADGKFQQSEWSPSTSATTASPSITLDVDIAPTTAGSSTPPFLLALGSSSAGVIKTSSDQVIFRLTTNALSGIQTLIKGANGGLLRVGGSELITSANADLSSAGSGFGLRNVSASNSAANTTYLGNITISSTPNDFTDTGATHKVGAVGTTYVKLFDSNSLPLDTGVTGFVAKFKPAASHPAGNYRETMTYLVVGTF